MVHGPMFHPFLSKVVGYFQVRSVRHLLAGPLTVANYSFALHQMTHLQNFPFQEKSGVRGFRVLHPL